METNSPSMYEVKESPRASEEGGGSVLDGAEGADDSV